MRNEPSTNRAPQGCALGVVIMIMVYLVAWVAWRAPWAATPDLCHPPIATQRSVRVDRCHVGPGDAAGKPCVCASR